MPNPYEVINMTDAVLVIDVQKDFCPGGALAVEDGHRVVPILNNWIDAAFLKDVPVCLSRDWHPWNHLSFVPYGGDWPPHCIQDTDGARFHPDLKRPENAVIVTKGVRFDQDQNSAFEQTGLIVQLKRDRVRRLWIGGLALDVCVLSTVMDAIEEGLAVNLLLEATRPVDVHSEKAVVEKMSAAGAVIITAG